MSLKITSCLPTELLSFLNIQLDLAFYIKENTMAVSTEPVFVYCGMFVHCSIRRYIYSAMALCTHKSGTAAEMAVNR